MPKAVGGHIVVNVLQIKKKTKGSILLIDQTSDRERDHLSIAKVISMGNVAVKDTQGDVNVGDIIQFTRYGGTTLLSSKDIRCLSIRYEDICAKYTQEELDLLEFDLSETKTDDSEYKEILKQIER